MNEAEKVLNTILDKVVDTHNELQLRRFCTSRSLLKSVLRVQSVIIKTVCSINL